MERHGDMVFLGNRYDTFHEILKILPQQFRIRYSHIPSLPKISHVIHALFLQSQIKGLYRGPIQRNAGAWSNKARTGNLKQFVETVNYLTENKLLTLEDLQERLSSVSEEFEALSGSMKKKSARIKELQELIREGENYQRLKPVHTELNNIKFKKQREKFETSHDAELRLFYAARRILKEKLDGKPIALKAWKQEYAQLKTEYAELSPQHKPLREEVIRLRQVQNAVDTALRRREQPQEVQRKKHEMEL